MYRPLNLQDILLIAGVFSVILVSLFLLLRTFPIEPKAPRKRGRLS
jgi:hypothetical protein